MPYVRIPETGRQQVTAAELEDLLRNIGRGGPRTSTNNMPRRIDHFANTSLNESVSSLSSRPGRRQRDIQAERESIQREDEIEQAQDEAMMEQQAGDSADRRAARLGDWRKDIRIFRDVLHKALDAWKGNEPQAATAFKQHLTNAMIAAEKEMRIYDIAAWYPGLPRYVLLPLRDLCKRLHGEAKLLYNLLVAEENAGGMKFADAFHPEMAFGMCCTKIGIEYPETPSEKVEVMKHPNFGTDENHIESLGLFDDFDQPHPAARPLPLRLALYRIQAQLTTRKMLLQPGGKNRFDTTSAKALNITYLSSGVTESMLRYAFGPFGNIANVNLIQAQGQGSAMLGPAKAMIEFSTTEEAASAHANLRNTMLQGMKIKVIHVTSDADRTTTWHKSVDKALCRWALSAFSYVKGKLEDSEENSTSGDERKLIVSVHDQLKAFCKEHNFQQIAMIGKIEEDYDAMVMMDSDPESTPELRAKLDQLEQQLGIFEEQFGAGVLDDDWRLHRSRE